MQSANEFKIFRVLDSVFCGAGKQNRGTENCLIRIIVLVNEEKMNLFFNYE